MRGSQANQAPSAWALGSSIAQTLMAASGPVPSLGSSFNNNFACCALLRRLGRRVVLAVGFARPVGLGSDCQLV